MLKITKTVEYALISIKHIKNSNNKLYSSKEISNQYNIPYELLSKILQKLCKLGYLKAIQGAYDANLANGGTRDKILENFNAQAARDAAYWAEINPPKKNPLKLPEGFSFGNNDGGVAGYFAGDTSPLTAYNTATGRTQGQIGTGTDTYDVRQLGLLEKARLIDDASRTFQTA